MLSTLALTTALATPSSQALRSAWDRGEGATALRPIIEAAGSGTAAAVASSTVGWKGLWLARIEHFEKVKFTGLKVNPHYGLDDEGGITSHVHICVGPIKGWASASGYMEPAGDGSSVKLHFDDFWISGDSVTPREAPPENGDELSAVDIATRALGRLAFFEGLAGFPVDYADMDEGLVAFRFPPLNSCIVAERQPEGAPPKRCPE